MEESLKDSIKTGKLKAATRPWHKYLENKELLLFTVFGQLQLIAIKGEKDLSGLCKYSWENDLEAKEEMGYGTLEDFIEEVELGNDGFGFGFDEIELLTSL